MAPIDYSKWDNIADSDSEPEPSARRAPADAAVPPRPAAAPTPSPSGSGSIQAVIVRCEAEKREFSPWSPIAIPADHAIFSQLVPPIPGLIGVPLVFHRVGTRSANRADLDNQITGYLNIDADSGFAPPAWQSHVGTVIVARKDRKPLPPQHLEGVWMYCDRILDYFGEGEGAPRGLYNRQAFEEWWEGYCATQALVRFGNGGEEDPDDWQAVRSPYEL